jgi:transcriptional regulator with XRE-family HTH domain
MLETLPDIDIRLGSRIRELRIERNLTLDALAQRAGVSRAMLSRIERGESSPTAQLLNKICGALDITLSRLFAGTETPASPLIRRQNQPVWRDPETGYLRRAVSPPHTGSAVDITEIEFPAHAVVTFDNRRVAAADQHIWVFDGTLEVSVGADSFRLHSGDCLLMRFGQPTVMRNPTGRAVRYAVIVHHGGPAS